MGCVCGRVFVCRLLIVLLRVFVRFGVRLVVCCGAANRLRVFVVVGWFVGRVFVCVGLASVCGRQDRTSWRQRLV